MPDAESHAAQDKGHPLRQVDDAWRSWIVESLLGGSSPPAIANAMRAHGFADDDIRAEIGKAVTSPYVKGAQKLQTRFDKYRWILRNCSRSSAMAKNRFAIERRHKLGSDEFFEEYHFQNRPVIITGMTDGWEMMQRWSLADFRARFGDRRVTVQFGRNACQDYEAHFSRHNREMPLGDYLDLIERCSPTNDFYLTHKNNAAPGFADILGQLKSEAGTLPYVTDMDGAVWIGPAGTITPLHQDPGDNLVIQVTGTKRVFVAPAHNAVHLYPDGLYYSPFNPARPDYEAYPDARHASFAECILQPGDILFLPVGCWHYVEALEISITFTCARFPCGNHFEPLPIESM